MVRTKLILFAIATVLAVGSAGVWFIISEKNAQARRATFLGPSKEHPTTGGQKMKVEW